MKIVIFLIINFLSLIYCYKCPKELCGGYNIGTTCYNVWTNSYAKCMGYLNKEDKNVISCFNYFNDYISPPDNISIAIIKDCKNENSIYRNAYTSFIKYTIDFLKARCIYENRDNLIVSSDNFKCNFDSL